jgi:rod shape-determining protein MreD
MLSEIISIVIRFVLLILLQVVVLNNIQLSGFINPFAYILFIMLLPVKISKLLLLVLSFITGITLDAFSDTMGMHAAASVFIGFCRPAVLNILAPREGYEAETTPSIINLGFKWFLVYASIMIVLHHTFLFYLEAFRFSEFFFTFFRMLASSLVTLFVVLILQFLFGKPVLEK